MLHLDSFLIGCECVQQIVIPIGNSGFSLSDGHWLVFRLSLRLIEAVCLSILLTGYFGIERLCFLVVLLPVLLVLLSVLSLPAPVGMAYLDSLQLVLDVSDLVLQTEVLHLRLVDTDDILHLTVVFHGQLL